MVGAACRGAAASAVEDCLLAGVVGGLVPARAGRATGSGAAVRLGALGARLCFGSSVAAIAVCSRLARALDSSGARGRGRIVGWPSGAAALGGALAVGDGALRVNKCAVAMTATNTREIRQRFGMAGIKFTNGRISRPRNVNW